MKKEQKERNKEIKKEIYVLIDKYKIISKDEDKKKLKYIKFLLKLNNNYNDLIIIRSKFKKLLNM